MEFIDTLITLILRIGHGNCNLNVVVLLLMAEHLNLISQTGRLTSGLDSCESVNFLISDQGNHHHFVQLNSYPSRHALIIRRLYCASFCNINTS